MRERPADSHSSEMISNDNVLRADGGSGPDDDIPEEPPDWFVKTDEDILAQLAAGRCTQGQIVDQTSYGRTAIYNRLQILLGRQLVIRVHQPTANYGITDRGISFVKGLDITPVEAEDALPLRRGVND